MSRRNVIAATLMVIASLPWLLTFNWRPMVIGVLALTTSATLLCCPRIARLLLPVVAGVAWVIFFIAGLHRDGIEIGGRDYVGMQLLTPFSIISLLLAQTTPSSANPGATRDPPS